MSLYGLDIIENEGERRILEINGVNSGMRGFEEIYGDKRVEERVLRMLGEKYGKLTVNDGTFSRNKYKKEHPFRFVLNRSILRIPWLRNIVFPMPKILLSDCAEIDWMNEKRPNPNLNGFLNSLEVYVGQDSTVLNFVNQKLQRPLVNDLIAQDIAENKFLQYMLLRNSEISENIIPSMLVGLGAADNKTLDKLLLWQTLALSEKGFFKKPILGNCGRGVKFLTSEEAILLYQDTGGPIYDDLLSRVFGSKRGDKETYLEDLVMGGDFSFEYGLSLLQPFIESKKKIGGEEVYSSIRAIVCNGAFVDAYERVSKNRRVNLSQDAKAVKFNYNSDFPDFCEKVIKVFEEKSKILDSAAFRENLYMEYFNGIERPIKTWKVTMEDEVMNMFANVVLRYANNKK